MNNIFTKHNYLSSDEKVSFIYDTLDGNALKQSIGDVENKIVITTVYAAKGLEWEYIILPDFEQYTYPNYYGMCQFCNNQENCDITIDNNSRRELLDGFSTKSVFFMSLPLGQKLIFI